MRNLFIIIKKTKLAKKIFVKTIVVEDNCNLLFLEFIYKSKKTYLNLKIVFLLLKNAFCVNNYLQ